MRCPSPPSIASNPPCSTCENNSSLVFAGGNGLGWRWFGILAAELHAGGCNFGNLSGGKWPRIPHKTDNGFLTSGAPSGQLPFNRAHIPAQISEHLAQFIGLFLVAVFAFTVLAFIFLYISSVFRFILFDSVLQRRCSIS